LREYNEVDNAECPKVLSSLGKGSERQKKHASSIQKLRAQLRVLEQNKLIVTLNSIVFWLVAKTISEFDSSYYYIIIIIIIIVFLKT